jgi:hypothetical protein
MSVTEKKARRRRFDDITGDVTGRTQAAIDMVKVAKATGIFKRLVAIVTGSCGSIQDEASDTPRLGERRNGKWRGKEDQGKDIESSDLTGTSGSGESSLLDQMGTELWNRFQQKKKQREQRKRRASSSREE